MVPTALFLFFAAAVALSGARIAMAAARGPVRRPAEEFFLVAIGAAMVIEALAGTALSFLHANSVGAYVAVAGICLLFGARRAVIAGLWTRLGELSIWRFRVTAAVLLAAAIPLFFLTLRPIEEADSVNYLHYLLEWRAGRLTPYTFSTNYVAFGPSRFMPALVLTRTDWFFGFVALGPLLLLGLALYLIADELEMPLRLRLWTVAAALALQHFWGCHSGAGTIKTDALHAAGVALLALVLLRAARRPPSFSPMLFALAVAFATEKYTGVFLCALAIGGLLWMRAPLAKMLPAAPLFLATTGHYYLRSLFQWGNPFYPFTVRLGPLHLPGTGDLSGTSILANGSDPRLWRLLFLPVHGLSPAGLLFPAMLALMLIAAAWTVLAGVRRRPPAFWLAAILLAGWFLFARTFFGAGPEPHSLVFLQSDLSTLRYVEGFLALGEVFVIWFLWKRGVPQPLLLALVALHGSSRLWLLYRQPNLHLFAPALWVGAAVIAGMVCLRLAAAAMPALAAALVIAAPAIVERNREIWFPDWKAIYQPIRELPAMTVLLFEDPASGYNALHFALCGPFLKHDVRTSPDPDGPIRARYVVRVLGPGQAASDLAAFTGRLAARGYRPVLEGRYGAVLEPVSKAPWDAGRGEAWYAPPGVIAAAGVLVDAGGAALATHRLQAGELALVSTGELLRLGNGGVQAPQPPEGAAVRLRNCGNLVCRFREGRWQTDRAFLPLPAAPVVSIERGGFDIERRQDEQGAYLRIRARNDARWLLMIADLPAMREPQPFTAVGTARCPPGEVCTFYLWTRNEVAEFAGPRSGEWYGFHLSRRARQPAAGDHLRLGREGVYAGDYFDVREIGSLPSLMP